MVASAQQMDSSLRGEANHYIRRVWQRGKSLKNASTKQMDIGLMAMLQWTVKSRLLLSIRRSSIYKPLVHSRQTTV